MSDDEIRHSERSGLPLPLDQSQVPSTTAQYPLPQFLPPSSQTFQPQYLPLHPLQINIHGSSSTNVSFEPGLNAYENGFPGSSTQYIASQSLGWPAPDSQTAQQRNINPHFQLEHPQYNYSSNLGPGEEKGLPEIVQGSSQNLILGPEDAVTDGIAQLQLSPNMIPDTNLEDPAAYGHEQMSFATAPKGKGKGKQAAFQMSPCDQSASTTLYGIPSDYATPMNPLTPSLLQGLERNDPYYSNTVSQEATNGVIGTAAPPAEADVTAGHVQRSQHDCKCGDGCECTFCVAHPYNQTSNAEAKALQLILDQPETASDQGSRPQSAHGPRLTSPASSQNIVNSMDNQMSAFCYPQSNGRLDQTISNDMRNHPGIHSQQEVFMDPRMESNEWLQAAYVTGNASRGQGTCQCRSGGLCDGCMNHDGLNGLQANHAAQSNDFSDQE